MKRQIVRLSTIIFSLLFLLLFATDSKAHTVKTEMGLKLVLLDKIEISKSQSLQISSNVPEVKKNTLRSNVITSKPEDSN